MYNLAISYFALGRHDEALELRERTLEFQRRVLPENHPDIGEVDAMYSGGARCVARLICCVMSRRGHE